MFDIKIEELRRMKTIYDTMEYCADLYGRAHYDIKDMTSVGDVEMDGFRVTSYLPNGDDEGGFIKYEEMLTIDWHNQMHLMISQREIDRKRKEAAAASNEQKKKDENDRLLYEKLKLKFQSDY
ncbi:hypothetical protein M0R04_07650 [Candidatus Dojkabacteria bacterium]|jgi:hypothetical protein|nr:hypothetical protein [Candidatus Dojkabacteria bacterium]